MNYFFRSTAAAKPVTRASTSQVFGSGNSGVVAEKVIVTVSDADPVVTMVTSEGKLRLTVA